MPFKTCFYLVSLLTVFVMGAVTVTAADQNNPNQEITRPDGQAADMSKPVQVFILLGQSNMVGIGYIDGPWPGSLDVVTKQQGKFPNLLDGSGNYLPRNDVWFEGTINPTTDKWLAPGCGAQLTQIGVSP